MGIELTNISISWPWPNLCLHVFRLYYLKIKHLLFTSSKHVYDNKALVIHNLICAPCIL